MKAFARISANDLENALENFEIPEELLNALKEAIKEAREGNIEEVPIKVFITHDFDDEEESDDE